METETNLKIMGLSRKSQNGEVIDNRGFDLEYDGNYADINSFINNKNKHIKLNNEELLELFNKPVSNQPLEYRLMNDFNTSSKMLNLMNTPLTIKKLRSSKSKTKSSKTKSSKSRSKNSTFKNYAYPLLNRIKVPKIEMENLIPYALMNTKLKSKSKSSLLKNKKSILKSNSKSKFIPKYTFKPKIKSSSRIKSKTMKKSKPKSNYVKFMKNNTNTLGNLLSPIRSPSRASRQLIHRATPYVRDTASKISNFIPQSEYNSLSKPIESFSQPQQLYSLTPLRENSQIKY
jgi:hypothetical protein